MSPIKIDPKLLQFAIDQDNYINHLKKVAFEFVSKSYPSITVDLETGEVKSLTHPPLQTVLNEISGVIKNREQEIIKNELH